jgi:hypothetical protein
MKSDVPLKALLRSGAGAHKTKRELTEEEDLDERYNEVFECGCCEPQSKEKYGPP